jgi:hypothetical protein
MIMEHNKTHHPVIRKASGETEPFDPQKLIASLQSAGAISEDSEEIAANIGDWLTDGITTKKIYARAYHLLRKKNKGHATRYNLKQALIELGSTGYPFEHLIGELFRRQGYKVEVGVIAEGRCITHEMDVIATKGEKQLIIECKYAQNQGKYVGIQVPLYVRSRVDDIISKRKDMVLYRDYRFTACVVTNTRFSEDSMQYARCADLQLLAWDYPDGNGLKDLLEKYRILPVTIMKHLTQKEKTELMNRDIVTVSQLRSNLNALQSLKIPGRRYRDLMEEVNNT